MSKAVANVDIATFTFNQWVEQTNKLLYSLTNEIVTANNEANGSLTTGNGFVVGILGANTIVVPSALRGGNVQSSNTLNITSATIASGNLTINASAVFVNVIPTTTFTVQTANSYTNTINTTLAGNTLSIPTNTVNFVSNTITVDNANINSNLIIRTDLSIIVLSNTDIGSNISTPVPVFSFLKASSSSGKITGQIKKGSNTQINEILVAHDTTTNTAQLTVYGTVSAPSSANLGVYSATTNATSIILNVLQTQANSAVKVVANLIK